MSDAKTLSIEEAGRIYYGVGRAASFKLARQGAFPLIGKGERYRRVSVPAMERRLLLAGEEQETKLEVVRK